MANQWFRLYAEFASDPKVQMMCEADQRRFVMLLCLRCSNGDVTLHDSEVAFQLRISDAEWAKSKAVFLQKNLIDEDNSPLAWDRRQFVSDSSAERVRRHRENKKKATKPPCNVTVTPPDTDTDTEVNHLSEHTVSESEPPPTPTTAVSAPRESDDHTLTTRPGAICKALRGMGMAVTNPSHPTLLALIGAGATVDEFVAAAADAKARSKLDFAYVLGTVRRRREEAAALTLHQGTMPQAPPKPNRRVTGRQAAIDNYAAEAAAARGEGNSDAHGTRRPAERDITGEATRLA